MGTFNDSIDLSTGPGKIWARSNGGQDAFVLLLDSLGNYRGHASFGGTGDDEIWSGAFSEKDNVVIGGQFYNTMDIDPTLGVQNVTSAGAKDMFLVKMALCKKDHLSYADTTCGSYTLPSGSRTFTQSGTYIDTLASISGCDSILTIQATILPAINPTLTLEDYGFHCRATGSNLTYQWINCQTGLVIQNATDSIYLPVYNGQFAVRVSNGNCTETSPCFTVANASIKEGFLSSQVKIFPNPTTGLIQIESSLFMERIEVLNIQGKKVMETESMRSGSIDLRGLDAGVYLIHVTLENGMVIKKVVKN
jgi:hypothetical protein